LTLYDNPNLKNWELSTKTTKLIETEAKVSQNVKSKGIESTKESDCNYNQEVIISLCTLTCTDIREE